MAFVALKCPSCGADIQLDDSREFGFCSCCGTKIVQERKIVEHRGSVTINGPVRIIDNRYFALLEAANNKAKMFLNNPDSFYINGEDGFESVMKLYSQAEIAGGSADSKYWESLADFYGSGKVVVVKKFPLQYVPYKDVVRKYSFYMDSAIDFTSESNERSRLEKKKSEQSEIIRTELYEVYFQRYVDRLTTAKGMADYYFRSPTQVVHGNYSGINAVFEYFRDAEKIGGKEQSDYWASLADFYYKAYFQFRKVNDYQNYYQNTNTYNGFMLNAISHAKSDEEKASLDNIRQSNLQRWQNAKQQYDRVRNKNTIVAVSIISGVIIFFIVIFTVTNAKRENALRNMDLSIPDDYSGTYWADYYIENGEELIPIDANNLYKYAGNFTGTRICTAIVIDDIDTFLTYSLQSNTGHEGGFLYAIVADFESNEFSTLHSGDTVVIAGVVENERSNSTVHLNDCHILYTQEEAEEIFELFESRINGYEYFARNYDD